MGSGRVVVLGPRKTYAPFYLSFPCLMEDGLSSGLRKEHPLVRIAMTLCSFLFADTRFSSSIIKKVKMLCDAGLASMAYFFFDFKDTAKRDARSALSSILVQLCYHSDPCSDILGRLFSNHHSGALHPSNDTLMECLKDMLALPRNGPTYIILDALDECPKSTGTPSPRESVLKLVEWLAKLTPTYTYASRVVPRRTSEPNFYPWRLTVYHYKMRADNRTISTTISFLL